MPAAPLFSSNFNPTVVLLCCLLQEFITQTGRKLEVAAPKPPIAVTNAVSWRSEGIKHRKNEVFLDVIESVNLLVSAGGRVLHSDIVGSVQLRVQLSGPPCTALSSVCVCVCVLLPLLSLSLSRSLFLCACVALYLSVRVRGGCYKRVRLFHVRCLCAQACQSCDWASTTRWVNHHCCCHHHADEQTGICSNV